MTGTLITIFGICFVFAMTCLGSGIVFFIKGEVSQKFNSLFLGFASGVMIASSVWSLILPAFDYSQNLGKLSFLPVAIGIIAGGIFLAIMDKIVPKILKIDTKAQQKSINLFIAITLHNMPEGLAVGLAFGSAFVAGQESAFMSALFMAIGIGLQNFPEGMAVSLPLKSRFSSRGKAFLYGSASGIVEPIMAFVGIWLALALSKIMPYLLAFSAGAMLFVVAEELLPDARNLHPSKISTFGFIFGFVLMMILDVVFG